MNANQNPRHYFIAKLILSSAVYRTHFPVLLRFYLVYKRTVMHLLLNAKN